jgi:signal transduction histidine kinase
MLRLRAVADAHPLLSDLAMTLALDALATATLLGRENRWWVYAIGQALVLPLAARRRQPFTIFLVVSAVAFVQWLVDVPLAADAALLLALYTVAADDEQWRAIVSALVLEVGVVLASVRFAPADQNLLYSLLFLTGLDVAALFTGATVRTRRAYLEAMVERARQAEIDRAQEAQLATSRERNRIAREMHDIVAHSLSVMIALADGAALTLRRDPEQAAEAVRTVSATGRESLREMRRLLSVLREDGAPADRTPQPGLGRLPELTERLRLVGPAVDVVVHGDPRPLPPTQDATAYRIVQESLTNVVKHASDATAVAVALDWYDDRLALTIRDNGRPVTPHRSDGHGLAGMAERAALFDGRVEAGPAPDGGWQVSAVLPLGAGV